MTKQNKQGGFTLVEMSIVLVIIGLIVGGVLVGQDLIKAARIRAVVAQIQSYDTSINAFMGKYDDIPGDISQAVAFGLGAGSDGDGNGSLTPATAATHDGEIGNFWVHLSAANMGDGSYAIGNVAGTNFPRTKLKKGGVIALSDGSNLAWIVGTSNTLTDATLANWTSSPALTAPEAFGIDSKLDDGVPVTGATVILDAISTVPNNATATFDTTIANGAGGDDCVANGVNNVYNMSYSSNICILKIRSSSGA